MKKPVNWKRFIFVFSSLFVMGCFSQYAAAEPDFSEQVREGEEVSLTGWARIKGEVMLYTDEESMTNREKYPKCISGVFENHNSDMLAEFHGRNVRVSGVAVNYDDLPDEDTPVLARKVLAGSIISNFCFGDIVLLVKDISHY